MLHIKLFWVLVTATTSLASTSSTTVSLETIVTVITASIASTVTDASLMIAKSDHQPYFLLLSYCNV